MGHYRTAQICQNGHCITDSIDAYPERGQPFCQKCGAKTITTCPSCNSRIRGDYYVEGFISLGSSFSVPAYCYNCGKPYPWTQAAIEAATELILEEENFSPEQQEKLVAVLPDIVAETPKTNLATTRFKKSTGCGRSIHF